MKPLRRHLISTSRKVLCTAALAASLTTAAVVGNPPTADAGESAPTPDSPQATDRGNPRLTLPDLAAPAPPTAGGTGPGGTSNNGIPATALDAYKRAELAVGAALPNCHLPWQLVAGIGRVESVHASAYGLKADGSTERPIRGPRLDGNGFAKILDTDKGAFDGDGQFDRAVGPLQFIPSTWAQWGADGNADGTRNPNNIYDAALGAGLYLCAGDKDLRRAQDLDRAVLSYNSSREYVNTVLAWMRLYQNGVDGVTNPPATVPPNDTVPPVTQPPYTDPPNRTLPQPRPKPKPKPEKPKPEKPKPEKPQPTVAGLERLGDGTLQAEAGSEFTEKAQAKAKLSDGKAAAKAVVVFEIEGDTSGTVFAGTGKTHAVVKTDAAGIATAPVLRAGDKAGDKPGAFTLRATVYGTTHEYTVKYAGTVTPKPAPVVRKLVRTGEDADKALVAEVGDEKFKQSVSVLAADADGKGVAGTVVTAGLLAKDKAGEWVPAETGPYFQDGDGRTVRKLELKPADASGRVDLPAVRLAEDVEPGTYRLRLTTPDGIELVLDLEVRKAADADPEKDPNPEASATPPATKP
ncbi:lytic transglycosylase domain-containing protein [Streptomyces sp. NRRL S-87]|uniref:lytic transglycosylase domain-containing protein n=1 Tax=Streptomyces sp. NRRL S-87 TaxID=1463920 RepID=UPI0004BEA09D|nr:lytic transglycosylase domain-containing protein [Streptomyces sp. NRRL S-87]